MSELDELTEIRDRIEQLLSESKRMIIANVIMLVAAFVFACAGFYYGTGLACVN